MSLATALFPPANRQAATVAFLRTAWQSLRATGGLGGAGVIAVSASGLASINWPTLGYAAAAVALSAIFTGALSAGNILANGLPAAYLPGLAVVTPATASVILPDFSAVATSTPSILPADYAAPVPSILSDANVAPEPAPVPVGA